MELRASLRPNLSGWPVAGSDAVQIQSDPDFSVKPAASNCIDLTQLQSWTAFEM